MCLVYLKKNTLNIKNTSNLKRNLVKNKDNLQTVEFG